MVLANFFWAQVVDFGHAGREEVTGFACAAVDILSRVSS